MSSILSTTDLTVSFGGLRANDSVNIEVEEGKLVGLIGPNGAGKTTLIDALTGFVPCTGSINFAGENIASLVAHERARRGLARTWQSLELFDDLTIEENLMVASERQSIGSFFMDMIRPRRPRDRSNVEFAIEVLGIGDLAHRMPTEISQGQRKLVSAARALAGRPKLLLMDEPAAGLDNAESAELGNDMRRIIDAGVSIFLIDHDMSLVFDVCDYVYVIEFGRVIAAGTPVEVQNNPDVIAAYLGSSHDSNDDSASAPGSGSNDGATAVNVADVEIAEIDVVEIDVVEVDEEVER